MKYIIIIALAFSAGQATMHFIHKAEAKRTAAAYPFLENFRPQGQAPEIGDCWLTTSEENPEDYQIHIYTPAGWQQLYVREGGEATYRHIGDTN